MMMLPLAAIATVFFVIWILALGIESWVRLLSKPKSTVVLPKAKVSLGSLLLFLLAPSSFVDPVHPLKFERGRGADS